MSPIQIITHLRSGTMLSWELLGRNFVGVPTYGGSLKLSHTHMVPEDAKVKLHKWYDRLKSTGLPTIYILRDGRDVLVSQFHFLAKLNVDFKGFIRGKGNPESIGPRRKPNLYPWIQERTRREPIRTWMLHSTWIEEDWVDVYRFEWIRKNQRDFILQLRDRYNLKMKYSEPQLVKKLVGIVPRKGIEGDWKNYFDKEDLEYYWSIAGERMVKLGYERLR